MAALGAEFYTKSLFNFVDVVRAVATGVRAEQAIVFIPGRNGAILDPNSDAEDFTRASGLMQFFREMLPARHTLEDRKAVSYDSGNASSVTGGCGEEAFLRKCRLAGVASRSRHGGGPAIEGTSASPDLQLDRLLCRREPRRHLG
jgi:hypothetical protein